MLTSKRVECRVEYNDGEFAEIQTIGIEGIEKNLLLEPFKYTAVTFKIRPKSSGTGSRLA